MYRDSGFKWGGSRGDGGPYIRRAPAFVLWGFFFICSVGTTIFLSVSYSPWFAFLSLFDLLVLYKWIESTNKFGRMIQSIKDYIDHFR